MKKFIYLCLSLSIFILLVNTKAEPLQKKEVKLIDKAFEKNAESKDLKKEYEKPEIVPIINSLDFVELGQEVIFDGINTKTISPSIYGRPIFSWDLNDGENLKWGRQIVHRFKKPGIYNIKLGVKQGRQRKYHTKEIIVFEKKGLLISDNTENYKNIVFQAGKYGIWLEPIIFEGNEIGFSKEEEFVQKIQEKIDFVKESKFILFDTTSVIGLQSFSQFWQKLSQESKFDLQNKLMINITEESLEKQAKLLQPIFKILEPKLILITRPKALDIIFSTPNAVQIINKLRTITEYKIVDADSEIPFFLPFSNLINSLVIKGISKNVIYLLLSVPFLAFVISFARQFIGLTTFGVYSPLMLSMSFLVLGFEFGIMIFCVILSISYLIRILFEKIELLYIPKISLLLSLLSLSFFLVLGVAVYFEFSINLSLAIFPMMVMLTVSEKFLSAQTEEGIRNAILVAGETVLIAFLGYLFVTWQFIESRVLAFPELILIPIFLNIWLGKFTGLRLSEYFKFRSLFSEDSQE